MVTEVVAEVVAEVVVKAKRRRKEVCAPADAGTYVYEWYERSLV